MATVVDPRSSREAAWETVERKREAVKIQRCRLEWALFGSARDLSRFSQQRPVQLANLIETLELALSIARELRDVMSDADREEPF